MGYSPNLRSSSPAMRSSHLRKNTSTLDLGHVSRPPRTGLLGWWLNLTAPPWPSNSVPIAERERLRKAELSSYSFLALFAFLVALLSNSLADPATAEAVGLMGVCLLVAAFLNRGGHTRLAAY